MKARTISAIIMTMLLTLTGSVLSACHPDITELQAVEQETIDLLSSLEQQYETVINENSGKVEVYVPDIMAFGNALDEAGETLPDDVLVIERIDPPDGLNPDPSVHFPQLLTKPSIYYDALYTGNLELKDGYLYAGENVIIWLPGYFVHNNNGTIEVWDREGNVVGRVGEPIYMGGGVAELHNYVYLLTEPLSPEIEGPFWMQAGARLNLNFESELFNLELIDCNGHDFYFFTKKLPLDEKGGRNYIITGILTANWTAAAHIAVDVRSDNMSGTARYTPIWPSDFTARSNNGILEILDGDGNIVARDGEEVTIDGIKIWNNFSDLYKQLKNDMPGECYYTNFLVERVVLPEETDKEPAEEIIPVIEPEITDQAPDIIEEPEQDETVGTDQESPEQTPAVTFVTYENRTPDDILTGLPVYPGSAPSTFMEENAIPRETPEQEPVMLNGTPQYRTASAEYGVDANMDAIIEWYQARFAEAGFHFEIGYTSGISFGDVTSRGIKYWLPSQPAVSVTIKAYPTGVTPASAYEILVSEDVNLAQPYDDALIPPDIVSIEITYTGYAPITITNTSIIEGLSGMVNALPVDPEYARFGPLPEPDIIEFTMVFHSNGQGVITVIERNNKIYREGYPALWDTRSLLMSKVKEIVQAEGQ